MGDQVRTSYENKINEGLTNALKAWWNSLTKEEILQYLASQETVTADTLRGLMADTNTELVFGMCFNTKALNADVNFTPDVEA